MFGRRVGAIVAAAALVTLAVGCGDDKKESSPTTAASSATTAASGSATTVGGSAATPTGDPIKLALVAPFSGAFADQGINLELGAQIALDQLNAAGGVLGRPVTMEKSDDQGDAKLDNQKINELASKGVHLTFGFSLTPGCLAAAQAANQVETMVLSAGCAGTNLIEADLQPSFFRVSPSNEMFMYAVASLAAKKYPEITKWSVIGPDYNVGREMWDKFKKFREEAGVKVEVQNEVFHPLDASDLTPHITAALRGADKTQGLYVADTSGLLLNLIKQAKPYDMFSKYGAVLNAGGFIPQAYALGSDVPTFWNTYRWADGKIDTPVAKKFAEDFAAKYPDKHIDDSTVNGYMAVMTYAEAIKKAGSDEAKKVMDVMVGLSFDSIFGNLVFGKNHQATGPMFSNLYESDPSSPAGFAIKESIEVPSTNS